VAGLAVVQGFCLLAIWVCLAAWPARLPAEESGWLRDQGKGLSERFLQQTEDARSSVPTNVWEGLQQAGWQVRLAEFVVDAAPELRNDRPRGWPIDSTWAQTDAVNLPKAKVLVFAEKRRRKNGDVVASDRVSGVFRHELGHAFDLILDTDYRSGSSNPKFVNAYGQDVSRFSDTQTRELAYYLQGQRAGRQEAFAEAFAILLGGGSDVTKAEQFQQAFPRVLDYLRTVIDAYDP
jgi:hypothetical protein